MPHLSRVALLFALLCAVTASAQTPISAPAAPSNREAGPTGKVTLEVVVARKSDPPVAGLLVQDFTILDNKVSRHITGFKAVAESQEQVRVTLIIDAVNTNFSEVANEREQIGKFLKSNGGHLAYPTTLAVFTDQGLKIQPSPTQDGNALDDSLKQYTIGLRSIRRSTGIYGADERTQLSLNTLSQLITLESQRPGRKIIVWISPGWPLLSGPAIELTSRQAEGIFNEVVLLSTRLRQANITLNSIDPIGPSQSVLGAFYYKQFVKGVEKPQKAEIGNLGLQVLAEQSGGRVFTSSNDIDGSIRDAVSDGSAYYELTFDAPPADHPDEYHQIAVQVARPGYTVRSQQGYYDQP